MESICKETNALQGKIRARLQEMGYIRETERQNDFLGNTMTEYYIKGDKIFEIERDLDNACVSATYCKYEGKQLIKRESVRLGDVLEIA